MLSALSLQCADENSEVRYTYSEMTQRDGNKNGDEIYVHIRHVEELSLPSASIMKSTLPVAEEARGAHSKHPLPAR